MRLFKRLKGLRADENGNVLLLAAAAMPLIVGSAGIAIDTIQMSLLKRHLQRAADSAALAGAYSKAQTKPEADVRAAVIKALGFNNAFPLITTPAVSFPATGLHAGRAVRVEVAARRKLPFWSFFFSTPPTITAAGTAALVYSGKYCMISLDEGSAFPGITFGGSADVNLGCGIISNTSGVNAVNVNSNGGGQSTRVVASPVAAVGGVPSNNAYQQPTLLIPYSLKQDDPFRNVPQPPPQTECLPEITDSTIVEAGKCYRGINVNGPKTLPSGKLYIVGNIRLNASADLSGSEVALILTHDSDPDSDPATPAPTQPTYPTLSINGTAKLTLTAPTSGDYKNLIMHYDGRAPYGNHTINGNSNLTLTGAIYAPSQKLTFDGTSAMTTSCLQLVAFRLTFEGRTELNNNCPTDPGDTTFDVKWVRLVA